MLATWVPFASELAQGASYPAVGSSSWWIKLSPEDLPKITDLLTREDGPDGIGVEPSKPVRPLMTLLDRHEQFGKLQSYADVAVAALHAAAMSVPSLKVWNPPQPQIWLVERGLSGNLASHLRLAHAISPDGHAIEPKVSVERTSGIETLFVPKQPALLPRVPHDWMRLITENPECPNPIVQGRFVLDKPCRFAPPQQQSTTSSAITIARPTNVILMSPRLFADHNETALLQIIAREMAHVYRTHLTSAAAAQPRYWLRSTKPTRNAWGVPENNDLEAQRARQLLRKWDRISDEGTDHFQGSQFRYFSINLGIISGVGQAAEEACKTHRDCEAACKPYFSASREASELLLDTEMGATITEPMRLKYLALERVFVKCAGSLQITDKSRHPMLNAHLGNRSRFDGKSLKDALAQRGTEIDQNYAEFDKGLRDFNSDPFEMWTTNIDASAWAETILAAAGVPVATQLESHIATLEELGTRLEAFTPRYASELSSCAAFLRAPRSGPLMRTMLPFAPFDNYTASTCYETYRAVVLPAERRNYLTLLTQEASLDRSAALRQFDYVSLSAMAKEWIRVSDATFDY